MSEHIREDTKMMLKPCPFCGGEARLMKRNRIIVEGETIGGIKRNGND